ncbi:MAG: WD40/YVTN/BNR-like repeat-containing protein [Anaerolineales bacterium]
MTTPAEVGPTPSPEPLPVEAAHVPVDLPPAPPTRSLPPIAHLTPGAEITITHIEMIDASHGWAIGARGAGESHVFVTADGADTWRDVTPPQPRSEEPLRAAGYFADRERAWVVYFEAPAAGPMPGAVAPLIVWRTTKGGAEWSPSTPVGVEFIGTEFAPPLLRFTDRDHGWLLANYGGAGMHRYPVYLLTTEDGGATWIGQEEPYSGEYLQGCNKTGLAFSTAGAGVATIDNCPVDGPFTLWTDDGGWTWQDLVLPLPDDGPAEWFGVYCQTHSPAWLSWVMLSMAAECQWTEGEDLTGQSWVYLTSDSGLTWEARRYPRGTVTLLDASHGWALGRDIHWTADGGRTWTLVKAVGWDGQFSFVDADLGWAVARSEDEIALVRTRNGGETWSIVEPRVGP